MRIHELSIDQMTGQQRKVYDAILAGPRKVVEGPLKVWSHNPELADRAQALGAYCRYSTALPARLSELAIIVVGAHWGAGFEWAVHAPIAISAGIAARVAETIRVGKAPVFEQDDERVVFDFVSEQVRKRTVNPGCYEAASKLFGPTGVVGLVGIVGYYTLISMTIVTFEVDLPQGAPDPFSGLRRDA